jgi:type I restriction enzyme S subunit
MTRPAFKFPKDWQPDVLSNVAEIVPGKTPAKAEYRSSGDIKMIKFRDVSEGGVVDFSNDDEGWVDSSQTDRTDLVTLLSDTILLTNAAHSLSHIGKKIGYLGTLPNATVTCFVGELTSMRAKTADVNSRWLYYLLQTEPLRREIAKAAEGAHLVPYWLKRVPLARPHLTEQTRIAETLNAADDHTRAIEEQICKAERVAVALDQEHFAAGPNAAKFPFHYGTDHAIPKGWDSLPLGKIAEVSSGITLNQDRQAGDNGVRYLTVINVHRGRIDLTEVRHLEMRGNEAKSKRIAPGDIMVIEGHANSGEIGRAALATEREEGMSFQNHLFRVRVNDREQVRPRFLVRALNSSRIRRHWVAIANTSSGLNTINRTALRRLSLQFPKITEQDHIVERLEAADAVVLALKAQLVAARLVKQSLLQNLLTGKLRLKA